MRNVRNDVDWLKICGHKNVIDDSGFELIGNHTSIKLKGLLYVHVSFETFQIRISKSIF
jgi:hypothetical protein